jgi:hypothetical protein
MHNKKNIDISKKSNNINIKLTERILLLLLLIGFNNSINAQLWSRSFTAGNYDSNVKFLGGSEVLQLIGHKDMLFASVGYWQDGSNIWYGGNNNNIGWGQIIRLDGPNGAWQEDLFLGANFLRPEILKQIIFTKDQLGNHLSEPDTVLIAAGYSPNYFTNTVTVKSFVRNDLNGTWGESQIVQGSFPAGENYSIRDIEIYTDQQTGLEYVFASVGTQGIYKGSYNPGVPGKIDWIATPEFGPLSIRPLGISKANETLYFSSGSKIYQRINGATPTYTVAHDFSDLSTSINSAVGGVRGLTTINNPSENNEALLLMWCPDSQSQGIIYRLEPDEFGGFTRIYESKLSVLVENYLPGANANYVLGAYNEFYSYTDPLTSDTLHLVGFEASISGGGYPTWNGYYKGALFAKRNSAGQYFIEEINGAVGDNDPALVANRCYVVSPFLNEDGLYYGGFDPNGYSATNMAWIFKNELQVASVGEFPEHENKYAIYPNPANDQLFIDNKKKECFTYEIISLQGQVLSSERSCLDNQFIDISKLSPSIYIVRIGNQSFKFIKI